MKKSIGIAFSGVICALSVVLLFLGSVVWIFAYVMPIVTGLLMIILTESLSKKTALAVYCSTGILSMFLLPDKESALLYILFFGYYPILKPSIEKIKQKFLCVIAKLVVFNAGVVLSQVLCVYVFGMPVEEFLGKVGIVLMLLAANIIFFFYDKLLFALVFLYNKKYKKVVEKYLK